MKSRNIRRWMLKKLQSRLGLLTKPSLTGRYRLPVNLAEIACQVEPHALKAPAGKDVFIFGCTHKWIQHGALTGMAMAGLGHKVALGYLPHADWYKKVQPSLQQRRDNYTFKSLKAGKPYINPVSLLRLAPAQDLPPALQEAVDQITFFDTQYTLQVEKVNYKSPIYRLRRERNNFAALAAFAYLQANRPDVVIVPNAMVMEFGAVYEVARYLHIPVVTYEFGDLDNRIWLALNEQVSRQNTDEFWKVRKEFPLTPAQRDWLQNFIASRKSTTPDSSFARLYGQLAQAQGGERVRRLLGLDGRPVVVMPTNVLGDSMTLDRQVFSKTMTEWIVNTIAYFVERNDVQLVIRVHPGENLMQGPSSVDVIRKAFRGLPKHIHIIGPKDRFNSYDLLEVASLGLAYTTTFGLELAVRGIPLVVCGKAHYRNRGFTLDPVLWDEFYATLDKVTPQLPEYRLTGEQLELAWKYAYAFFREFALPFPWHTTHIADRVRERPMAYVLSEAGRAEYGSTFRYLVGEPVDWAAEIKKER